MVTKAQKVLNEDGSESIKITMLTKGCDHAYSKVKYHPFYAYLDDDALIQEQRNFLREVVKKTDFQNSEFRVVLAHAPGVIPSRMTDTINKICNGILWGEDIDNQIDLYVAGHTHRYCRSVQYLWVCPAT